MLDPATIDSERLRRFYEYWNAKRGSRAMPARRDIDPVEFPWALGDISLIDAEPDGEFRWRLDGTNLAEFFHCEMTGKTTRDYGYPEYSGNLRGYFAEAVRLAGPTFRRQRFVDKNRSWNYAMLILPLSSDGKSVDMLIQMIDISRQ